ncbi:hypothetical protein VHEMI01625 [[Torrubiella] hemipterigena]|uniref:Peptidase M43 pregnancy-associated plasma-A domain-containing protein n=1 Tax=[Torrubiella] hemipterigena TaxID=1531966 RepID=A0A0A1SMD7_9HYPO|nr:hypothetical protein VHEMI01625 [[Torrubiella] hemipterigena]
MLARLALLITLGFASALDLWSAVPSCSTPKLTDEQRAVHAKFLAASRLGESAVSKRASISVDSYVHVVTESNSPSSYYLTMRILNAEFARSSFTFRLAEVDWLVKPEWARNQENNTMMTQLRKGSYRALNLYFLTDSSGGHVGYCSYPTDETQYWPIDGCIISAWTVPGNLSLYTGGDELSHGMSTVHEVGHWQNLMHTFEGDNCAGDGDLVDDTPAEASAPTEPCPTGRNTCSQASEDPIHNHMDYSHDSCKATNGYAFTDGQIRRMEESWYHYRSGK